MNVVSFETAKQLKEAGFPQPKVIKDGLCGYAKDGRLFCVVPGIMHEIVEIHSIVFAPSATDILKELGRKYILCIASNWWYCEKTQHVNEVPDGFEVMASYGHENPAEACAAAWLAKNEKP